MGSDGGPPQSALKRAVVCPRFVISLVIQRSVVGHECLYTTAVAVGVGLMYHNLFVVIVTFL